MLAPTPLVLGSIKFMDHEVVNSSLLSRVLQETTNKTHERQKNNSLRNKFEALIKERLTFPINAGPMMLFTLPTAYRQQQKKKNQISFIKIKKTTNAVSHLRNTLSEIIRSTIPKLKSLVDTSRSSTRNSSSDLDTI